MLKRVESQTEVSFEYLRVYIQMYVKLLYTTKTTSCTPFGSEFVCALSCYFIVKLLEKYINICNKKLRYGFELFTVKEFPINGAL